MKTFLLLLILFQFQLLSLTFKVATYNVENLFDLKYDGTEYKEFIPNTKQWNKKTYYTKLKHTSRVIKNLNADIIALQEIESQKAFNDLKKHLSYRYGYFLKNKTSSIGVAILSKFKIISTKKLIVDKNNPYSRYILKASLLIDNKPLIIYVNHWRSKRAKENKRIIYATRLLKDLNNLDNKMNDYIILGDLNSNYDEYITFKYDKNLNNTYGITGINQVLNTTLDGNFITKEKILDYKKIVHYNLWLELPKKARFSLKFRKSNETIDNIILPKGLFDKKNISYVPNSFKVFKPKYLYKNGKINRWNKNLTGYSDHLPIYALFTTDNINYKNITIKHKLTQHKISELYRIDTLNKEFLIKNAIVIYKYKNNAIIKQKHDRAILLYHNSDNLKLGYSYNINIDQIDKYFALKEIKSILNISQNSNIKYNINRLYIDSRKIDLFNEKYQNEIIKNLRGRYKKGYLLIHNKQNKTKIKLYFQKNIKKPKENSIITIKSGHLAIYKSQIQIIIHKKTDFN